MNVILQINPKFEQIIPPLTAEEFAQLEENILKLGRVTDPIQVWRDDLSELGVDLQDHVHISTPPTSRCCYSFG